MAREHIVRNITRTLQNRTHGLYKKGNALFNMLGPKIAIIVVADGQVSQGYVTHDATNWPEFHQLAGGLGIAEDNMRRPDDYDTITERRRQSFPSRSSSVTLSFDSTQSVDESDRAVVEVLAVVDEEPSDMTDVVDNLVLPTKLGPAVFQDYLQVINDTKSSPHPWSVPHTPEPETEPLKATVESSLAPSGNLTYKNTPVGERVGRTRAGIKKSRLLKSKRHATRSRC